MQRYKRILLFLMTTFVTVILSACQQQDAKQLYQYLMQHPDKLRGEITRCRKGGDMLVNATPRCKVVMRAAKDVMSIIEQQQQDPEKFGKEVLKTQMEIAQLKKQLSAEKNASKKKQLAKTIDEKSAKLAYQLTVMLRVIGLTSPE